MLLLVWTFFESYEDGHLGVLVLLEVESVVEAVLQLALLVTQST